MVARSLLGPSRLSQILTHLQRQPKLVLPGVRVIKLKLATRNDHFGARHFLKEELPRIRYANPDLDIEVNKIPKQKMDTWNPELELRFEDKSHTIPLAGKWSTTIVRELMDLAGGDAWAQWKAHAIEAGTPIVPGEENAGRPVEKKGYSSPPRRPTLAPWKLVKAKNLAAKLAERGSSTPMGANMEAGEVKSSKNASSPVFNTPTTN